MIHFLKKFKCGICDKKFKQQEDLMQHEQVIHGDNHYDCKMCNETFSSMEQMRNHLQRHHSYHGNRDI